MTVATESTALDELCQELLAASIQPHATQRKNGTLRLLYSDSRVDEEKLEPILRKYAPEVSASYAFPEQWRLPDYGFQPEQLGGQNGNGYNGKERVDVITLQLREYED